MGAIGRSPLAGDNADCMCNQAAIMGRESYRMLVLPRRGDQVVVFAGGVQV